MKLSEKEIKIIIDSLQFENFSDTKTEDRVKLLNRFRKKLKYYLLHPVIECNHNYKRRFFSDWEKCDKCGKVKNPSR